MPVAAVTATASGRIFHLSLSWVMISRSRTDLPVPEGGARIHSDQLQQDHSDEAGETHRPTR